MHKIFVYGSNLNLEELKSRKGISPKILFNATLSDFKLAFTRHAPSRKGGVLDITKQIGHAVPGVVYICSDSELKKLDEKEGYPTTYDRIKVGVSDPIGNIFEVQTYQVKNPSTSHIPPHSDYLESVKKGYEEHCLNTALLEDVAKGNPDACQCSGFFAYGTLMRGQQRFSQVHRNKIKCSLLASVSGFLLKDHGPFPSLNSHTLESNILTYGDFFLFESGKMEEILRKLDQTEGYSGDPLADGNQFNRIFIFVDVGDGRLRPCWTYIAGPALKSTNETIVLGGSWRRYKGTQDVEFKKIVEGHFMTLDKLPREFRPSGIFDESLKVPDTDQINWLTGQLGVGTISERRLAQASNKWAVLF